MFLASRFLRSTKTAPIDCRGGSEYGYFIQMASVSTDDAEVRQQLRSLGQPQTLFGEGVSGPPLRHLVFSDMNAEND